MASDRLDVDFLVIGAGMAGMTAAGYAASQGATVAVIEKAPQIGGSAVLSGGCLWTAESIAVIDEVTPLSEAAQRHRVVQDYRRALDWIASTGVMISPMRMDGFHIKTVANLFDVAKYMQISETYVSSAGGHVVTNSRTAQLLLEDGRVAGAAVQHADGDVEVHAPWTLLATGGFQANAALREKYIGPGGADLILRSNPCSTGDGLQLGLSAGAALSAHMDGYYGHTIAMPRNRPFTDKDFLPLSQYFLATHSLVLGQDGRRFMDESSGYYEISQAVQRMPARRALVVFDDQVRLEDIEFSTIDRTIVAEAVGAHLAKGHSWEEVERQAKTWGYSGVAAAVAEFNRAIVSSDPSLAPGRRLFRRPLDKPPFFAIEAEPAITFTQGGLRINRDAHVLNRDAMPVPGLLAAGADAGGTYHIGYGGGLSMATVFGLAAADVALTGLRQPS